MFNCKNKNCGTPLFYKDGKDKIKMRTNIVIFEKSQEDDFDNPNVIIKCSKCKTENEVPLQFNKSVKEVKLFLLE